MKCTCGLNVVTVARRMACPDCGAELVLDGETEHTEELADLRAQLAAVTEERDELLRCEKITVKHYEKMIKLASHAARDRNAAQAEVKRLVLALEGMRDAP